MNNDELKKKINEIISHTRIERLADALIAAGIGDVETVQKIAASATAMAVLEAAKAEHRAEVAERALRNAATRLKYRGGLGKGFCRVDKCNYYHCNNDNGCIKAHLEQAEKELAVERKDD